MPRHVNPVPGSAGKMFSETGFAAAAQLVLSDSHVHVSLEVILPARPPPD